MVCFGPFVYSRGSFTWLLFCSVHGPETRGRAVREVAPFVGLDQFGQELKHKPLPSPEVVRATRIFEETIQLVDGHYELGLPWIDALPLPDNRDAALRWFFSQEARIIKNTSLAERSCRAMQENVKLGFARKLTAQEERSGSVGRVWYNKYHPVINPNKPDKCRMVFDLSAMFSGVSLNSKLVKGPDLLANQVGVTLRFRHFPYAIAVDIEKMFYQVRVRNEDASAFRYWWRKPGSQLPPDAYEMTVHLFGATSSPAVCCFALQQAAKDSGLEAERLLREVIENFYVDNWLASFQSKKEGVRLAKLLVDVLKRGGFNLTQFASSHPEMLSAVRSCAGEPEIDMSFDDEVLERTLGLVWRCFRDKFMLSVSANIPLRVKAKRELLTVNSKIYDPLGFLAAIK